MMARLVALALVACTLVSLSCGARVSTLRREPLSAEEWGNNVAAAEAKLRRSVKPKGSTSIGAAYSFSIDEHTDHRFTEQKADNMASFGMSRGGKGKGGKGKGGKGKGATKNPSYLLPVDPNAANTLGFITPENNLNPLNANVMFAQNQANGGEGNPNAVGPAALQPGNVPVGVGAGENSNSNFPQFISVSEVVECVNCHYDEELMGEAVPQ